MKIQQSFTSILFCTSWDLEVWATKPPPWKWMSSQGERGCFCTQGRWDTEMGGGSAREYDSSSSLSYIGINRDEQEYIKLYLVRK